MYDDYRNASQKNKKYNFDYLQVYDVTLRDGEQTPGIAYTIEEKIEIAKMLNSMGVKYIEAGFPVSGEDEAKAIRNIINLELDADIYALCRLNTTDIDFTYECGVRHIAIFCPGSDYLIRSNLRDTPEEIIERLKVVVDYAKSKKMHVRFGCEDASRTDMERLLMMYHATIDNGVDMVAFADTLGVMTPLTTYEVMCKLKSEIKVPMAIHCHNDYGVGLANVLSAIEAGVEQIHVSINGLGERCGNVSLEELIVCLLVQYNTDLGFDLSKISEVSDRMYRIAGFERPFNKPIVGKKAFTHESGIHVNGILNDSRTYQPFPPEIIGRSNEIVLGKHSGMCSVKYFLDKYQVTGVSEKKAQAVLDMVKAIASKKIQITNDVFMDILNNC